MSDARTDCLPGLADTLYHGTSTALGQLDHLRPGSYATDDKEVALSYAREKAAEIGGDAVLYEVQMDVTKVVQEKPYKMYQAESRYHNELGFRYWTCNVPVACSKFVEN